MGECQPNIDIIEHAIEEYSDMIIRIAYQNLHSKEDSEDIAQEVFIKLISNPHFNDKEHLKAWLIRVTVNLCKDYHRKRKLHNRKTEELAAEWEPFTKSSSLSLIPCEISL